MEISIFFFNIGLLLFVLSSQPGTTWAATRYRVPTSRLETSDVEGQVDKKDCVKLC